MLIPLPCSADSKRGRARDVRRVCVVKASFARGLRYDEARENVGKIVAAAVGLTLLLMFLAGAFHRQVTTDQVKGTA